MRPVATPSPGRLRGSPRPSSTTPRAIPCPACTSEIRHTSEACTPPIPPPTADAVDTVKNFGVDASKLPQGHLHWINGRLVTRDEAHRAITTGGTDLNDDTGKLRLTVVGTAGDCQRVLSDLGSHPSLAGLRDRFLVQTYRPEG